MFEAIARGEIKALWVMGTNPAVSLPDADAVREALKKLELFVVSENVLSNDTVECRRACAAAGAGLGREIRHRDQFGAAHLAAARVPAARRARPSPTGGSSARSPSASASARRSPFNSAADIFREHAALSAFENDGNAISISAR
jgi:assimilatory nitrate reductase catalytic subunit